jgi:formyl-CoA transferase
MGISFLAQIAGKSSITLNLKSDQCKAILKQLSRDSDVLVENFRPGVMRGLQLEYTQLQQENASLIYCAISGFGQEGPWRDRPAYDQIIQGLSGVMSITGEADGGPLRAGHPIAETVGGLTSAMAIMAALNARPRGCLIDISMLEATLATMGWAISNYLIGGIIPKANGNESPTSAPSGTFQASDAMLNIAANKDAQWRTLARHLGRVDLLELPEYNNREARKCNRFQLKAELETVLTRRPARLWAKELTALGVPAGEILTVPDILLHPQITDRGLLAHFANVAGVGRSIDVLRTGVKLDGVAPTVEAALPVLGANNDRIYGAIGLAAADLVRLKNEGVI